jgi:outer membrane protein assembly factor BamB
MTHARQVIASPHLRVIFAVLATLSWVLGSAAAASAATAPSAGDWPTYLHDPGRTAASTDSTLSPSNAAQLTRAWSFATGGVIAASSSVQGGTVYVGSWDGNEYAIDAATGTQKWKTFLGITTGNSPCDPPQAGVTSTATVQDGIVYVGGGDSYWYALDATSGAVLWQVFTGDNSAAGGHYNWSSPLLYNGSAYIGIASFGDCPLVQGQLLQVSLTTHQVVSTFNVVPNGQVGGGIWSSPSVDPASNTVYVTTGSGDPNQPYVQAIIGLDATTLAVNGSWALPANDPTPDADWGTTPTLFSDASGRQLVAAINKNGYAYAFNRNDVSSGPIWQQRIAIGGDCPTCGEGSVSSGAFGDGLLYFAGGNTVINGVSSPGSVRALDPGTGAVVWAHPEPAPVIASLAYANGLLFDGAGAAVEALNATSGAPLWSFSTGGTIYGAPSIAEGMLFAGSVDHGVYAFGLPSSGSGAQDLKVSAPTTATAGQAFTATVTAEDALGNPVTTYNGTVHFSSSDPAAALPADYTFTTGTGADNGTHPFQGVALKTVGTQTITATDTVTGSITGSASVTVGPAAAASLALSGLTGATAGTPQTVTLTATDAYGNRATGYGGTVAFTSSDGQASLPSNYTFVPADAGLHTYSGGVTLRTPGTQSVTGTDAANPSLTSTQSVTITPSVVAASLSLGGLTNATAGSAQTVTVTAKDASGNGLPGYRGTVSFSSTDGQASLPGSYTFAAADNGVHTFSNDVTLKTAGTQALTATDTANSSVNGSQTVTISAGALASLALSPGSSSITAGGSQSYIATGADQYGNSLGDVTATTTFSIAPDGSCSAASCTATVAGGHAVTGSNAGTTATASLNVVAAAASQLTLTAPTSARVAQPFQVIVTLMDPFGNVATGYTGTVHFGSSDSFAMLPPNYQFTSADAGTHTFSVTLMTPTFPPAGQTITVADIANGSLTATSPPIVVNAA